MNLNQLFRILRARSWLFLLTVAVTVGSAAAISLMLPKQYTAKASLVIDYKNTDPLTGTMLPTQLMPGYLATQIDILTSHNVALKVVQALKLDSNATVRQQFIDSTGGKGSLPDWLADALLRKLKAEPSRESSVIRLSYTSPDPHFSQTVVNAFAQGYIQTNLELRVEPARQSAHWYDGQINALRERLAKAQTRLSAYQKQKGIVATDERLDVETAKLADLSNHLIAAQSQRYEDQSKALQARRSGDFDRVPEVLTNPMIQSIKTELAQQEAKLHELSDRLGSNHPQFLEIQAQVSSLRQRLNTESAKIAQSVSSVAHIAQQREGALRGAVGAQKSRVLELNRQRDEMNVLVQDVENAQRAYNAALQRFSQASLESQTNQTNIAVLNPAIEPTEPSSPIIVLNLVTAFFLSMLLGTGLVFLYEMADRRIRSISDIKNGLELPVLGTLAAGKRLAARPGRRIQLKTA